jgi:hypothetical protein
MSEPTSFPLAWPVGHVRTAQRRWAKFKTTLPRACDDLYGELAKLHAVNVVLSTNVPVRQSDGRPYSDPGRIADPGAAVYFRLPAKHGSPPAAPRVIACDRWLLVEHNVAAIAHHIEALRGIDRWGCGTIEQAFAGYAALPAVATPSDWREVLGVGSTWPRDKVRARYLELVKIVHPDRGGGDVEIARVNAAWEAAEREFAANGAAR